MKPLLCASVLGTALTTTACGYMTPAKDPDSLTVQMPLEETPPPSATRSVSAAPQKPTIESRLVAASRRDLDTVCADLVSGDGQCSGEVFRNVSATAADNPLDDEQFRTLRNRCLALMAECQKEASVEK